ncbi:hypothetical protein N7462_000746 [Penicillium macrosclerotiorum]|uniref:uncharacterized protein n=1 Tax=Penicillium macrosclerotiorum TaxID=303699 RepID=UPI0025496835|nr:uncharacterized protein N7462_000746 [Penicillium macrosclerotiorum]KAJ5698741.1 hypothetical protein N7462_000746 [Penicillium macrosclerotiorum]
MAVGGCFCGNIRVEITGEPLTSGLCHCLDCRKLTGGASSWSFVVKSEEVKVSGTAKAVRKTSDSGNEIRNYFCPECGTPLYGRKLKPDGDFEVITIVRAGIFDDSEMLNKQKPVAELFTERRLDWTAPIEGAAQVCGMLKLPTS